MEQKYDLEKGRQAIKDCRERYAVAHACCPNCGYDKHGSTYVGFFPIIKEDYTVEYKDENRVWCKCGWQGITHDLVPDFGKRMR